MKLSLTNAEKARMFDLLFEAYVTEKGLGGMQKSDFDALLLWLVASSQDQFDPFTLSNWFKIKESRIKSLIETAAVKFAAMNDVSAWSQILATLAKVEVDVASIERGQIRFQLSNPSLYRWLQARARMHGATAPYDRYSEEVTLNLDSTYKILDELWADGALGEDWTGKTLSIAQANIQNAIGRIGKKIGGNELEALRKMKSSQLKSTLTNAANLASIGSFIAPLLQKFATS